MSEQVGMIKSEEFIRFKWAEALSYIKDENWKNFIVHNLKKLTPEFYEKGASSSGKYHIEISNGFNGLFRHTMTVLRLIKIFEDSKLTFLKAARTNFWDNAYTAALFHDIQKYGIDNKEEFCTYNHSLQSADYLENNGIPESDFEAIKNSIRAHNGFYDMSGWKQMQNGIEDLPVLKNPLDDIVHVCDVISSRKFFEDYTPFIISPVSEPSFKYAKKFCREIESAIESPFYSQKNISTIIDNGKKGNITGIEQFEMTSMAGLTENEFLWLIQYRLAEKYSENSIISIQLTDKTGENADLKVKGFVVLGKK